MIDLPLPCRFVQELQWKAVKKQENKWSMRAWKMWGIWIASEKVLLHNFSLSKECDSTILDSSQLHERPPKHTTVKIGRCALAWEECFPGTICYSRYVIQVWPGALLYYHYWLLRALVTTNCITRSSIMYHRASCQTTRSTGAPNG